MREIAGYELLEELRRGSGAVIYNARREGQEYVVKLLTASPDEDAVARMRREIKLMSQLSHPSIVALRDWGEIEGQLYLVMEKVEGETLRNYLDRQDLNRGRVLDLCEALLEALSYAHSKQVIHRDLKPENLMLQRDGRLRLLDFGLTRDNFISGTPAYLAPERLMGLETPISDQYSAGSILYEMLVGQPPIARDVNIVTLITRQLYEVPPRPAQLDPTIPDWLDHFVMKLLAKRPEDRFATTGAALEEFRCSRSALQ